MTKDLQRVRNDTFHDLRLIILLHAIATGFYGGIVRSALAAHAGLHLCNTSISLTTQASLVDLTGILITHATNLVDIHTTLHQLGDNLTL